MVDSIFKDESSQAGIRALLKAEAQAASTEHQRRLADKTSPDYNPQIEQTTCEVTLQILHIRDDGATDKLYEKVFDDAGPDVPNPLADMLPDATERQRRFFNAAFLCSAISNSALEVPGNKILKISTELTEYEDDGQGDEFPHPIFEATTTFDADGMPVKVELADQNGPVKDSEMPKVDPIQ